MEATAIQHSSMGSSLILLKFSMGFVTPIDDDDGDDVEEQVVELIRVLKLLEGMLNVDLLLLIRGEVKMEELAVVTATCDAVISGIVGVMLMAPLEFLTKSNRSVVVGRVVVGVAVGVLLGLKVRPPLLLALTLVLLFKFVDDDAVAGPVTSFCLPCIVRLAGLILMGV